MMEQEGMNEEEGYGILGARAWANLQRRGEIGENRGLGFGQGSKIGSFWAK